MASRFAAIVLALTCAGNVWGAETTTIQNAAGEDITVYVVADGFYQNAATYSAATDFYITSKAGLEYFRDLVSACDGGTAITAYINGGFYPGQNVPGVYSNNLFKDKKVNLLCDIDLENEDWTPIGYPNWAYNNGSSKTQFYGSFNGNGHKISNLKVVANAYNQNQGPNDPAKYYKNYGAYGLFGALGSSGSQVFENLTIVNVTAVVGNLPAEIEGGTYIGAIVGNLGNNATTFRNCTVIGLIDLQGSANSAGGLYGIGSANVENCVVNGDSGSAIISSSFGGGLVGAMRQGNDLNVTGNTVSGLEITSYRAGSLVGAMALGVAGACSVTDNDIVDCIVNGEAATLDNLFGPSTATTEMTYARNTVRTTLIVETGDLTPEEEITPTTKEVNYTVPVTVKDRSGNVVSETTAQEIAVSVAKADIANTTLASVKIGDVVAKAIESAGEDATSVTAIEIQVKASTEAEGEVQAITYEVHPEAVVKVTKTVEQAQTTTESVVELSNTDLAADAVFTFELDVSALGLNEGDTVRITHSWDAYTDASGNAVAAGSETTLGTVSAGQKVQVTTTHFSTWTLEGVTVESETVAIVFAANGAEIDQYSSIANAIAAETTVNGCTVLVLDGEHDCGSETITINKEITLTGQSKAGTVLNFTATGKTAFSIQASNVTIKDMTINQADTGADTTLHVAIAYTGSYSNPMVAYSDITLQNLKFTGSKYSISVYAEDLTIDSCDFVETAKSTILLYCVKGTTRISNNTFVQTSPSGDGFIYGTTASGNDYSSGKLVISGNTATGGRVLYHCNNQNYFDATTKMTLEIVGNTATGYNNKAIVFAGHSDVSLASVFNSITITNNVLFTSALRPTIQRDDSDTSLEINAKYNYWGDKAPNYFKEIIPGSSDKMLVMGDNITYEPYYITYNSETGELSDLRPLPAVAQIGANKYETLAEALAAAQDGDTVVMLDSVDLYETIVIDKSITLDLNGNRIGAYDCRALWIKSGDVTIAGGETGGYIFTDGDDPENPVIDSSSSVIRVGDSAANENIARLTIGENVSVDAYCTYAITVFGKNDDGNSANGEDIQLVVNGSVSTWYDCEMPAISGNGSTGLKPTAITIAEGATVYAENNYAIYHPGAGTLTVYGTVTGTGGIEAKAGKIIIAEGEQYIGSVTATAADEATHPSMNNNGTSTSGYAIAVVNNSNYAGAVEVSITKEAFIEGKIVIVNDNTVAEDKQGSVKSEASLDDNIEDDYKWVETEAEGEYKLVPKSYVAQIGSTKYETLAEAIAAANEAGEAVTITMLGNVDVTNVAYTVSSGTTVTLDLNGKTVKGTDDTGKNFAFITNNGTLTITDTSTDADGVLVYGSQTPDEKISPSYGNYTINSHGTLTIKNGTIENTGAGYACYAINSETNGSLYSPVLNIEGGCMVQDNPNTYAVRVYSNSTTKTNTANITGGVIEGGYGLWLQTPNASANKAAVTISGGVINADDGAAFYVGGTIADNSGITIAIDGGEINGTGVIFAGTTTGYGSISVSGGYMENVKCGAGVGGFISGGSFGTEVAYEYCAEGYIPAEYDSATGVYTVKEGVYVAQILENGYVPISAPISEASDDVYIETANNYYFRGRVRTLVDEDGNPCPAYLATSDDTKYYFYEDGIQFYMSAKYAFDTYYLGTDYNYQTSELYEISPVSKARYETLAEAFAAVQDGETIQLIADVTDATMGAKGIVASGAKTVTLDLAGFNATCTDGSAASNRMIKIADGLTLNVVNTAETQSVMSVLGDEEPVGGTPATLPYGVFRAEVGTTLNIDGGEGKNIKLVNGQAWGLNVKLLGATATLSNIEIESTYGGGIEVTEADLGASSQAGYAELTDCTFTQTGYFDHCSTALSVSGGSELVVNSGTYTSENYGLYVFSSGGKITVKGGTITGENKAAVKAAMDTNTYPAYTGAVQISGGRFTGALDVLSPASMSISGGVFSSQIDVNYCAVGYNSAENTDEATKDAYPYTVAHKAGYIVEDDDGAGYAVIPAVDADWIAENVEKAGETATTAEIEAALNTPDATTNLKTWQAYVLNQAEPIKATAMDDTGALATTLVEAKTGTGLDVSYSLVKIQGSTTNDTACAKDAFKADLDTGLYKVRVHFKPSDDVTAAEVTVDSENTVGVLKTAPASQFVVVPVPFKAIGADGNVTVADYIKSGLADGDTLHVYNGDNYDTWTYNGISWEKTETYTKTDENTESVSESAAPASATLARGTAAILRRAENSTGPLVFVGDYAGAAQQEIAEGWNLVASPSLEAFDPATKFTSGKIQIPTGGIPKNYTYSASSGKWGYLTFTTDGNGNVTGTQRVEEPIPAGTGFWYISDEAKTVEW